MGIREKSKKDEKWEKLFQLKKVFQNSGGGGKFSAENSGETFSSPNLEMKNKTYSSSSFLSSISSKAEAV